MKNFKFLFLTIIIGLSSKNIHCEIVTPSLTPTNYTINPSATAFRAKSIYSGEIIYDNYHLTKSEIDRDMLDSPTPSDIQINLIKLKNILASRFGRFVPELFVSLEDGSVKEREFTYPSSYVDGMSQTFDGEASSLSSHLNLGIEVFPGFSIGLKQFYAFFKAKYKTDYDYTSFGTGTEEGKAFNYINGYALGSTIRPIKNIYVGAMYFNSKKHYDTENHYTDTLGNNDDTTDDSIVDIVQYAYGAAFMNGTPGKNRLRLEIYRLTQKARDIYKDWDVKDGELDKCMFEIVFKGISFGIHGSRYRGDYLNIYRLSDGFFFTLYPSNDYTYQYGAHLGLVSKNGLSISLSGIYSKGELTQNYYLYSPDDGSAIFYTDKKKVKHYSVGLSISYLF